jgi:hypothetical protein
VRSDAAGVGVVVEGEAELLPDPVGGGVGLVVQVCSTIAAAARIASTPATRSCTGADSSDTR